jgi:glycosyltransferase involved in cell wall biosynthesis
MGLSRLRVLPALVETIFGSLRHSAAVLVATAATRAALPPAVRPRCVRLLENAVDPERFAPGVSIAPPDPSPGASQPLRVSFVGRLVPVKALPLLLQALARLQQEGVPVSLDVVGDGPMAPTWRAEAAALGLADCGVWHGALPAAGVAEVVRRSHVFCLPSVRESGGAVLLEAMACARPVIGMDFGGPAELVDDAVGWKVAMPDEATAVDGIAQALRDVVQRPADAAERGLRARRRVLDQHTWAARIGAAEAIYAQVLNAESGARRPGHSAARSAALRG